MFRALFITLMDFIRFMSTIINDKHIEQKEKGGKF